MEPENISIYEAGTLLSETDPYGTILFANNNFCRVSQYTLEELMGQPHSIIRHPDMPKKLFQCLWETIKKGEVFRGIIKNKAKDGSHYWVNITILPISDGPQITKYLGGRHHIKDDKDAEELYKRQAARLGL